MDAALTLPSASASRPDHRARKGLLLVAAAALAWSFGGTISRFIATPDSWTVVFWRSYFATLFLLLFMGVRDGPIGTVAKFRAMGLAGIAVGTCFAIASTSFVVALSYTTVANILLMQAGAPLIAALLAFVFFHERVSATTWVAIAAVIAGVGIMVSQSLTGKVSLMGDGLALIITLAFSIAIVITRRHAEIEMVPAVCLGTAMAFAFAACKATVVYVSLPDLGWLVLFGAVNLGLGLAMFVTGARALPAALAALISTLEPVLAPLWVWLMHGEVPSAMTLLGGGVVFAALLVHVLLQLRARAA
ncbi:MAG: DMT family transporter [Hyphomicrobiales bacterium]